MIINTNTVQHFSSQSGIKVTQNKSQVQNEDQNNSTEVVSININSNTSNTLALLSSLEEKTFIKRYNNFISDDMRAIKDRLEEVYSKATIENKKFVNSEQHISEKYFSPNSPYYIGHGLSKTEKDAAYRHEIQYLRNGRIGNMSFIDPVLKDLKAINGIVESAEKNAFNRDRVNEQFQQLLDRYGISIPKDVTLSFSIDPYDYKVSISGLEDKNLSSLIEDVLNTADNSKELFFHISYSRSSILDDSTQFSDEKSDKYSIFHEIKDLTGYDLRDLKNIEGKFLTEDGTDILELLKIGISKSTHIPKEYKCVAFEHDVNQLSELAKRGFENVPDLVLSIDYRNGSFYDVGQSENYGVEKRAWIDTLKDSYSETLGEAFKSYREDSENKQDIIKEALNFKDITFNVFEGKSLFDKYGDNIELIKLELMRRFLIGEKDEDFEDIKKIYELLKEWEENKATI